MHSAFNKVDKSGFLFPRTNYQRSSPNCFIKYRYKIDGYQTSNIVRIKNKPVQRIGLKILYKERVSILHYIISNLYITHTSYGPRVNKCREAYGLWYVDLKKMLILQLNLDFYR